MRPAAAAGKMFTVSKNSDCCATFSFKLAKHAKLKRNDSIRMLLPRKFASCAEKKHGHGYDPMKKYGYDPIKCHVQQSPLEPWKTFSDWYKRSMVETFRRKKRVCEILLR